LRHRGWWFVENVFWNIRRAVAAGCGAEGLGLG